ncbi:hypothetical protein JB92DRAFT_2833804 [Gautieria morchelliformis]|nr:hypothetical protein JB92DRAFT_2833804 [Gautieria morchelliformis]
MTSEWTKAFDVIEQKYKDDTSADLPPIGPEREEVQREARAEVAREAAEREQKLRGNAAKATAEARTLREEVASLQAQLRRGGATGAMNATDNQRVANKVCNVEIKIKRNLRRDQNCASGLSSSFLATTSATRWDGVDLLVHVYDYARANGRKQRDKGRFPLDGVLLLSLAEAVICALLPDLGRMNVDEFSHRRAAQSETTRAVPRGCAAAQKSQKAMRKERMPCDQYTAARNGYSIWETKSVKLYEIPVQQVNTDKDQVITPVLNKSEHQSYIDGVRASPNAARHWITKPTYKHRMACVRVDIRKWMLRSPSRPAHRTKTQLQLVDRAELAPPDWRLRPSRGGTCSLQVFVRYKIDNIVRLRQNVDDICIQLADMEGPRSILTNRLNEVPLYQHAGLKSHQHPSPLPLRRREQAVSGQTPRQHHATAGPPEGVGYYTIFNTMTSEWTKAFDVINQMYTDDRSADQDPISPERKEAQRQVQEALVEVAREAAKLEEELRAVAAEREQKLSGEAAKATAVAAEQEQKLREVASLQAQLRRGGATDAQVVSGMRSLHYLFSYYVFEMCITERMLGHGVNEGCGQQSVQCGNQDQAEPQSDEIRTTLLSIDCAQYVGMVWACRLDTPALFWGDEDGSWWMFVF